MRHLWYSALVLSLGLIVPAAHADDGAARPVVPTKTPVVTLGYPIPVGSGSTAQGDPAGQVTPSANPSPAAESLVPRPLPVGPSLGNNPPPAADARKSGDVILSPIPQGATQSTEVQPEGGSPWWRFWRPDDRDGADCGCSDGCCVDGCAGLAPGNRFYVNAEYLMWWFKGQNVPPLVTTGSINDAIPGALGMPGTTTLFGGRPMENGAHSGTQLTFGYWFCDDHALGFEASFFLLGPSVTSFAASSNGTPILARPFIDAASHTETTELVAGPNVLAGSVAVQTRSSLWGTEANFKTDVWNTCHSSFNLLAGFKSLGLDDDLDIHESLTVLQAPGGGFAIDDHFGSQNRFYGGQIGAEWERQVGRWVFNLKAKLAMGVTNQIVNISGSDTINDPTTGTHTYNGGLLAQQSNIGTYSRDRFTVVPDMCLTVGYQLTPRLRCFAGYNLIYWSDVARAANQIDRTVNQNQIAPPLPGGPARPAFGFNGSDFWAQGFNIGLEYRW